MPGETTTTTDEPAPEELVEIVRSVRLILAEAPSVAENEDRTVRETFDAMKAGEPAFDRAEAILTDALRRFPLHPYLLSWRANVRLRKVAAGYLIADDS